MGELVENGTTLPPFLVKCYELVDDPATDPVISWSSSNYSFVIWKMSEFSQVLLPKYFKHNNFSSFMRQLNTYGFRKSDPDRWEFTNDGFVKGQKHLLKNISRRKQPQGPVQQNQSQQKNTSVESCLDVNKFGLWEEVEMLKKDKNTLMQELVNLRQHQESAKSKVLRLRQRLQGMERNQQQMLSFLVMAMQSPGFLVQLLQPKENHWCMDEIGKKRRLPMLEQGMEDCDPIASDGQMVKYRPPMNETPKPLLIPISNIDETLEFNTFTNGLYDFSTDIDLKSLPMEEASLSSENDCPLIISDIPDDDMLEQLLLASSIFEDIENTNVYAQEIKVTGMEMESAEHATQLGNSQNLDILTEQMGLLASETNNSHEKM